MGIKPLYQLVKEDNEGRSVVYERVNKENDKNNKEKQLVIVKEVMPIVGVSDFFITYVTKDNFQKERWLRFVNEEKSPYQKSQLIIVNEKNQEEKVKDTKELNKILKPKDVIAFIPQKDKKTNEILKEEEDKITVVEKIYLLKLNLNYWKYIALNIKMKLIKT